MPCWSCFDTPSRWPSLVDDFDFSCGRPCSGWRGVDAPVSTPDEFGAIVLKSGEGGEVVRLVSSGNPVTRRYLVKISLADPQGLVPGMFGRSVFTVGTRAGILIPPAALAERGGLTGVFVVGEAGVLRFRWVRTGAEHRERTEITAGLDAGETLLAQVTATVKDGDLLAAPTGSR